MVVFSPAAPTRAGSFKSTTLCSPSFRSARRGNSPSAFSTGRRLRLLGCLAALIVAAAFISSLWPMASSLVSCLAGIRKRKRPRRRHAEMVAVLGLNPQPHDVHAVGNLLVAKIVSVLADAHHAQHRPFLHRRQTQRAVGGFFSKRQLLAEPKLEERLVAVGKPQHLSIERRADRLGNFFGRFGVGDRQFRRLVSSR